MLTPVIGALAFAPSVSARSSLRTGTYSGKTKQKVTVGFELATSPLECPGGGATKLCLYQLDSQSANILLACPGGGQDGVQELISPVILPASGSLRGSFGQTRTAGRLTYDITVKPDGILTGWFEDSFAASGSPTCYSGKVTFSAKRTSGLKR